MILLICSVRHKISPQQTGGRPRQWICLGWVAQADRLTNRLRSSMEYFENYSPPCCSGKQRWLTGSAETNEMCDCLPLFFFLFFLCADPRRSGFIGFSLERIKIVRLTLAHAAHDPAGGNKFVMPSGADLWLYWNLPLGSNHWTSHTQKKDWALSVCSCFFVSPSQVTVLWYNFIWFVERRDDPSDTWCRLCDAFSPGVPRWLSWYYH